MTPIDDSVVLNENVIVDDVANGDVLGGDVLDEEHPKITLLPTQVDHVQRIKTILKTNAFALDFSSLGAGKTFTSSYIATEKGPDAFNFKHIIVVAPVSVKTKWLQMKKDYDLPMEVALSFCELRSVKCKQPKHGLLHRKDYTVQMNFGNVLQNIDKCSFTPSDKYKKMVNEGLLLIVDEMQNVKNISSQFLACQALIKTIVQEYELDRENTPSRVLMLSGSPIDKKEQAVHMFRTLNIMKCENLASFNLQTWRLEWKGMRDIYDYCEAKNNAGLQELVVSKRAYRVLDNLRATCMREFCYDLFQQVLKPVVSSSMSPPDLGLALNKRNGFYHIRDKEEHKLLADAVGGLQRVLGFRDNEIHTVLAMGSMQAIQKALLQVETAKIGTFVRLAKEALANNPQQKVAICVNYNTTIYDLCDALAEYQPLVLNGAISVKHRCNVLRKFQAPTTDHRVIIGNVAVCSTGIDLDDKDGRFPRIAFVSANYSTINLYQLGFRFLRADSKSSADIYFVYGAHANESGMLNALSRKSSVMKQTTPEQAQRGVVFPMDHERYDEPEAAAAEPET